MNDALKNAFSNLRVVLCEPRHAGNIGAAARAMRTMGLTQLTLVNPEHFPSAEATRRASRATDVLENAQVCTSLQGALSGVVLAVACSARSRELAVPQTDVRTAVQRLAQVAAAQPVALVFGNETYGLTTAQVNLCQLIAAIPTDVDYASLNLAAAVQVFAYEFRLAVLGGAQANEHVPLASDPTLAISPTLASPPTLASHEALEGFYAHLESALIETGYLNPDQPKKLMQRLRRLYARAALEQEEVNILRGVVRTLRQPKKREIP